MLLQLYCTLSHVVSRGLIRTMFGLFRATESRVPQSLVSNSGPKFVRYGISRSKVGDEACHSKITVPLRHVLSFGLKRVMFELLRATECWWDVVTFGVIFLI